jgi:CheY-like chemotaxis protein
MNSKKVLIIEDRERQRKALHKVLERRGFTVKSAGSVATAQRAIEELYGGLDVMIMDMHLGDDEHPEITGADLGLKAKKMQPVWPPEFLIHSGVKDMSYYQLALRLGAAAYLLKHDYKPEQVVPHVRALALRRALSIEREDLARRIEKIGESSQTAGKAVRIFCRDILIPELEACLGAPFVLLLRDHQRTILCGRDADLPVGEDSVFETVRVLTITESNGVEPFIFDASKVLPDEERRNSPAARKLNDGAFISLINNKDFPLTLGILKAENGAFPLADSPQELAQVLIGYLKPAVLEQFLRLLSYWTESKARRDERLAETSRIFLYIGQEQLSILQDAHDSGQWSSENRHFQKLQALADDLYDTGQVLSSLRNPDEEDFPMIDVAEIARMAWTEIGGDRAEEIFSVSGNCNVRARSEDLFIIITRILQWFIQRFIEYPYQSSPVISIVCFVSETRPVVTLEDRSRRLSEPLRRRLFDSFAQTNPIAQTKSSHDLPGVYLPLYLAKALVEEKYSGRLEERSDEMEGDIGHRFVMQFQPVESPELETAIDGPLMAA